MDRHHHPTDDLLGRSLDRRTLLRGAARTAAGLWVVGSLGGLAGACGGGDEESTATSTGGGANTLPAKVKVGVIAPLSGFAQFVGELTERGVQAAIQHLVDDEVLPGTTVDYQIVDAPVEQGAQGAVNAYNQLAADPEIMGVLWAALPGVQEAATQIGRDQMPVLLTTTDAYSPGWLDPAAMPTIYQLLPPNNWLLDTMCQYAGNDRGYATTALMLDTSVYTSSWRDSFTETAEAAGLEVVGVEEFTIFTPDFGAQLQRLKSAAPQCLQIWGLDENVARIGQGLADLDALYVDTPTARSGEGWHPQLLGPGGAFGASWAALPGDAAQPYIISVWYVGGSTQAPEITPLNQWVLDATGNPPEGGEELPANGLWALLEAARQAGSTDRDAVSETLPGLRTQFATLPFTLDPDTHVTLTRDDITLSTLERRAGPADTDPPYVLGREVTSPDPRSPGAAGPLAPSVLVRPTLEANLRAQPEYMAYILENGFGTQCTKSPPDATGEDVEMTDDCKIH
ncbi:MAG: ABC transporter substrate-binding protein [Acidimicrobiales bacterium]|jgi:ABC-type branched-subunit amino acid transport system substrate-binding protein|nr:ABC transporter substrate-binding protein [Acidimicrobiales bacterium]